MKFFGGKLGKSGSSLTLSALSAHFQPSFPVQSIWAGILALSWTLSMYLVSHYLYYRHPDSSAHKKDDDEVVEEEPLILSNTTSESNLSGISESAPTISLEEFVDEDLGLEGISPPDGWIFNELDKPTTNKLTEPVVSETPIRRVRFQTPSRRDSFGPSIKGQHQQPNYLLRIGSTHVSLSSLGEDDSGEQAPGIFSKTGFYW